MDIQTKQVAVRDYRFSKNVSMEALMVGEESSLVIEFSRCIAAARTLLEEGRLEEAFPVIQKAIQLGTACPEGFNLLGILNELRGDQEAARRMYRVALAIDATYSPASYNLDRLCQWKSVGRTSPINFGDRLKKELSLRDLIVK